MKQHITIDQLNELSHKAESGLNKWIDSKGDSEYIGGMTCDTCGRSGLLDIGQMIEFLYDNLDKAPNPHGYHLEEIGHLFSRSHLESFQLSDIFTDQQHYDELCDALWSAVKTILEQ